MRSKRLKIIGLWCASLGLAVLSARSVGAVLGYQRLGQVLGDSTLLAQTPTTGTSFLPTNSTSGSAILSPLFQVNIPAVFADAVTLASLVVEEQSVFNGQARFVDEVVLENGAQLLGNLNAEGIDIDVGTGEVTASNLVYSVIAGGGIEVSGDQDLTITNTDRGSAQKIFGKIKVGSDTAEAGSNTDTFEFSAGSGIALSLNTSDKKLTLSADNLSGWYKANSSTVALITSTNNVGIGTTTANTKLEVDSGTSGESGISLTRMTSSSTAGIGGGKVLSVDSGGRIILVQDQTGDSATPSAEAILPTATNGMTLYFNGTNWAASNNLYHDGGSIGISTTSPVSRFHVFTNLATKIGQIIQGYAGQTANLTEWRDSSGSVLSYIDANGVFNGSANVAGSLNPGLTNGSVLFQGASGITQDNSNFFWDDTNNYLGIGTSTPARVVDIIAPASSAFRITRNTSAAMFVELRTGDFGAGNGALIYAPNLAYTSNGTSPLVTFTGSGTVGIGTTAPLEQLHVTSSGGDSAYFEGDVKIGLDGASPGGNPAGYLHITSNWGDDVKPAVHIGSGTYGWNQYYNSSGNLVLNREISSVENTVLTMLRSNGYVGIGTTAPGETLDVQGGNVNTSGVYKIAGVTRLASASNYTTVYDPSGTSALLLGLTGSDPSNYYKNANHYFTNKASSAIWMTINSSGLIGVGTTTPGSKMHIFTSGASSQYLTMELQDSGQAYENNLRLRKTNSNGTAVTSSLLGGIDFQGTNATGGIFTGASIQGNSESIVGNTYGRGNLQFLTSDGNAAALARMTISNGGYVGIGTSSPSYLLHVYSSGAAGTIEVEGSASYGSRVLLKGGSEWLLLQDASGYQSRFRLHNNTNNITALTAMTDGRVGVGFPVTSTPTALLHVEGGYGANDAFTVNQTLSGNILSASASGATKFVISNAGNVGINRPVPYGKLDIQNTDNSSALRFSRGDDNAFDFTYYATAGRLDLDYRLSTSRTLHKNMMSWDAVTGNVAIGTTSPGQQLELYANAGTPTLRFNANNAAWYGDLSYRAGGSGATKYFSFDIASISRMVVNADGNVGIGTTTPGSILHLESAAADPAITIQNKVNPGVATNNFLKILNGAGTERVRFSYDQQNVVFGIAVGTTVTTPHLAINNSGYVGIGTTNPGAKLHVTTDTTLSPTYSGNSLPASFIATNTYYAAEYKGTQNYTGFLVTNTSASGIPFVQFSNTNQNKLWTTQLETDKSFAIREGNAAGSTRLSILEGGNVGVGTTSPTALLHVNGGYGANDALTVNQTLSGNILSASASGTTKLVLKNSGFLGLGTITPSEALDVVGGIAARGGADGCDGAGCVTMSYETTYGRIQSWGGSHLALNSAGNNVGIGTTAPATALHVYNAADNNLALATFEKTQSGGGNAGIRLHLGNWNDNNDTTRYSFRVTNGNTLASPTAETFRIGYDGTIASAMLTGNTATVDNGVIVNMSSTGTAAAGFGNAISFLGSSDTTASRNMGRLRTYWETATDASRKSKLTLSTYNGTTENDALTIDGSGNVGIGTTSSSSEKLDVQTSSSSLLSAVGFDLLASYTGGLATTGMNGHNWAAGTGSGWVEGQANNSGLYTSARGTTVGNNIGVHGHARGGNVSVGMYGDAGVDKASATNIGVIGVGANAGASSKQIGGFFSIGALGVPVTTAFNSGALVASNGSTADSILRIFDDTTEVFSIVDGGNVGIGTTTFGTSAAKAFAIAGSTAPSTSITDGVQLFAVDVTGSHELQVRDEAGNVTTLSPHNFSLLDNQRSEDLAWAFYSERNGLAINADMTKALRVVEKLSGEQLIRIKNLTNGEDLTDFYADQSAQELALDNAEWITRAELNPLLTWGNDVLTIIGKTIFEKPAEFLADITIKGRLYLSGKDVAGQIIILPGDTQATVTFQEPFKVAPIITLTTQNSFVNVTLKEVSTTGFTIAIKEAQVNQLTVLWSGVAATELPTTTSTSVAAPTPSAAPLNPSPTAEPSNIPSPSVTPEPTVAGSSTESAQPATSSAVAQ